MMLVLILGLLLLVLILISTLLRVVSALRLSHMPEQPFSRVGASFSIWYARWLAGEWGGPGTGSTWQESLQQTLQIDGKKIEVVRLSVPWRNLEEEGFGLLDEALNLCGQAQVKVILVAGVKTPRWPEVYIPQKYVQIATSTRNSELNTPNPEFDQALLEWIRTLIKRYDNHASVEAFQIENEALEAFGDPRKSVPFETLKQEVELAKTITQKPLLVTMGAGLSEPALLMWWHRRRILGQLVSLPVQEIGFNVYQSSQLGPFLVGASPLKWLVLRRLVQQVKSTGKTAFISELQAEPWANSPSKMNYKDANGNPSFSPRKYQKLWHTVQKLGCDYVLLWGLEFQNACVKQGNKAWIETTKTFLSRK